MTNEPEEEDTGLIIYAAGKFTAACVVAIILIAPITLLAWLCKTLKTILTGD